MNRIALNVLALLILTIAAFGAGAPAAVANHHSATYTGKSDTGADVRLTVTGDTVVYTVANDPCGQGGSGQAGINGNHAFGGAAGNLLMGGIFSAPGVAEGWYMFPACRQQVHWTARKFCDCEDTSVHATRGNVGGHSFYKKRLNNNESEDRWRDFRDWNLHLVVKCVQGTGDDCSGWATATVTGADVAVPAQIDLRCSAKGACPEKMEAKKTIRIRVTGEIGQSKTVTIKVTHACTDGTPKTTTLKIKYGSRGWFDKRASDLNGDGQPDRIS